MTERRTFTTPFAALILGLAAAACNETPTNDLGYTSGNLIETPAALPPVVAKFTSDFEGVWIGEADDPLALLGDAEFSPPLFRFPSGSTRLRLEVRPRDDADPSRFILTFGDAPLPPPPTDPDLGYPVDPDFSVEGIATRDTSVRPPVEGFGYLASGVGSLRDYEAAGLTRIDIVSFDDQDRLIDGKLEISFAPTQFFGSWCALQTADTCPIGQQIAWDDPMTCTSGLELTPIDCQKVSLCASNVCSCPESGPCRYSVERLSKLTVRLSSSGGLVGLFSGAVFVNERGFQQPLGTVRFQRDSAEAEQ
jgi:hypothetical protein